MVLALQSPETVTALIKGMKDIFEAHVTKQSEADKILAKYEPVQPFPCTYLCPHD